MYSFPNLEPVRCSMSSFNCCFLNCIQISLDLYFIGPHFMEVVYAHNKKSNDIKIYAGKVILPITFFGCTTQHVESSFPDQGSNLCLLHWKLRVLTIGNLSLFFLFFFWQRKVYCRAKQGKRVTSAQKPDSPMVLFYRQNLRWGLQNVWFSSDWLVVR